MKRVAFTGHRPNKLGGYGAEAQNLLQQFAAECLKKHNVEHVITGMALGWDQAVALAAIDLDIPFIAAIPFEYQDQMWPPTSRRIYHEILMQAHDVVVVCAGDYAAWKMQERNEWMVDYSDRLIALWDGTDGGTANCVRYAKSVDKPIINVWEEYNGFITRQRA